jgi:predicted nucleotidyltransferase
MTRDEIIARLKEMEPALRARGITRLQMFGSRARGDNREDSDLDLLVEYDPPPNVSGFDFFGIGPDLSDELGIETRLIDESAQMKPRFRQRISDDLLTVF